MLSLQLQLIIWDQTFFFLVISSDEVCNKPKGGRDGDVLRLRKKKNFHLFILQLVLQKKKNFFAFSNYSRILNST